jgi:hypothetical protein
MEATMVRFAWLCLVLGGCGDDKKDECTPLDPIEVDPTWAPNIDPANFVAAVDHPFFPLVQGTTFVFEGSEDGEAIHDEFRVTTDTKVVMGVTCVVVNDHEEVDGVLSEDTFDWFAQDMDGNVWYMGEDSTQYEDGEVAGHEGSWEGGVDGAYPGITMPATNAVGDAYRQEYYPGEAEDLAEVTSTTETVDVPYGLEYTNVLVTREWSPLDACVDENKFYAEGVGMIKAKAITGSDEIQELIEIQRP